MIVLIFQKLISLAHYYPMSWFRNFSKGHKHQLFWIVNARIFLQAKCRTLNKRIKTFLKNITVRHLGNNGNSQLFYSVRDNKP